MSYIGIWPPGVCFPCFDLAKSQMYGNKSDLTPA